MITDTDIVIRMLLIALMSGIVGLEREHLKKAAGIRTIMLVGIGSTLIMIVAMHLHELLPGLADPGRFAGQVITGVGFLGAGAIIRDRTGVHGLTTAASVWVIAAIGLSVGMGYYMASIIAFVVMIIALFVFGRMEKHPDPTKEESLKSKDLL